MGKMGFWEYGYFRVFVGSKLFNLGPIDFKLVLLVNIMDMIVQKNFKPIYQKSWPKWLIFALTLAPTFIRHNSATFYPILTRQIK